MQDKHEHFIVFIYFLRNSSSDIVWTPFFLIIIDYNKLCLITIGVMYMCMVQSNMQYL